MKGAIDVFGVRRRNGYVKDPTGVEYSPRLDQDGLGIDDVFEKFLFSG